MKLSKYMEAHGITDGAMALKIHKDRTMIGRYRRGEILPPADVIHRIQKVTNLAVQFNDWFVKD